jgi:hypothetical protein
LEQFSRNQFKALAIQTIGVGGFNVDLFNSA